jgi:hypothetical protein
MPVKGATNQNQDNSCTSAPKFCKILEAFPFCRANPNWMPKNPKLMENICQKFILGFSFSAVLIIILII